MSISFSVYVMSGKLSFSNNLGVGFVLPSTSLPMQTCGDQVGMEWRRGARIDCKTVSFFSKMVKSFI